MNPAEAFITQLADMVADRVVERIGRAPNHYSARALPPGKSKAWALRNLKHVRGAKKVGRDWVVSVDDFEAWLSERDTTKFTNVVSLGKNIKNRDVEALADEALTSAGMRRVARSR